MLESDAHNHKQSFNPFTAQSHEPQGKESIIAEHCRRAIDFRYERCIWLCIKRGRKYNLVDIPIKKDEQTIGLYDVRKRYGWWKRHSLYSVVAVKEVRARVLDVNNTTRTISVVVTDFDWAESVARVEEAQKELYNQGYEPGECGMNVNGDRHDDTYRCGNTAYDEMTGETYCKLKYMDDLNRDHDGYRWLTPMLEYYWQNGIDAKGLVFLERQGFVTSYDDLIYDRNFDAANPYGRILNVFLVVQGWDITLLLLLIGFGVFLTICVVSIVTAVCHDFEIGLTAGSYAASLIAVLIAVFTFLSAVI